MITMDNKKDIAQEILNRLREYMKNKEISDNVRHSISDDELLEYLLSGIDASKDIQSSLYPTNERPGGIIRKIKNLIIGKVSNITRNVVELSIIKQQRFNEGLTGVMAYLVKENKELKKEVEELKNARK